MALDCKKLGWMSTFCSRCDYEQVKKYGLVVESKDGDFNLPEVHAYNDVEKMPQCDYEVEAGAKSYGRIISDRFIQTMLDYTVKMTPYRPRMKIDYDERKSLLPKIRVESEKWIYERRDYRDNWFSCSCLLRS